MSESSLATSASTATSHGAGSEQLVQREARATVTAFHAAVRAIRLYPLENSAVQKTLVELSTAVERVLQAEGACELRRVGDYVFVNDARIRLGLDNYAAVTYVLALLREAGVGGVRVSALPASREWVVLATQLLAPPVNVPEEDRCAVVEQHLAQSAVTCFELETPYNDVPDEIEADAKERARQTYVRGIDVTREVMTQARLGKSAGLKRVKRAVQGIVDAILSDPSSLIGLTTLREFDEYTFVHSVNVCILSVALGRQTRAIPNCSCSISALSALLHDIGKSRVPLETLNKRGITFSDDGAFAAAGAHMARRPCNVCVASSREPGVRMACNGCVHSSIILRIDLSAGIRARFAPAALSLFSKIIAVADGFRCSHHHACLPGKTVVASRCLARHARQSRDWASILVVVKAFINLTGIYPVGTLVVLDTFEMGLVHAIQSRSRQALSRPIVRLAVR